MLGRPYVPPKSCSNCSHDQAVDFESEKTDAFEACFAKYLSTQSAATATAEAKAKAKITSSTTTAVVQSQSASASPAMDTESDFLQSLFLDMEQVSESPPASASSGSSGSSNASDGDHNNHTTPATDLSPTSPPGKFADLDLDGFTPGVPTFPIDSINKSTSSTDPACSDYLNCKPQTAFAEAITPGKTVFTPTLATQNPQFKQELADATSIKPSLSIFPNYQQQQHQQQQQQQQQHSVQNPGSAQTMDAYAMIDPALTSLHGLPSAAESAFSPAFSHQSSEPPSAMEPASAASTKATKSRKSSEQSGTTSTKGQPKRKRARKTEVTSPQDVEKQARFLERNRNAASRCRARRKAQNDRLEIRAGELERERDGLRLLHQSLMSEKAELLGRILDLGCDDECNGAEGMGHMGGRAGKPPRDLLASALNEMVMGSPSEQDFEESVQGDDAEMAAA